MHTLSRLAALSCAAGVLAGCASNPANPSPAGACTLPAGSQGAIVTMVWQSRPADSLCVHVQDTATARAARDFVRTQAGPHILSGRIVRGSGVDPRVPFHYLPDSAKLVDMAIELCDSKLLRTTQEVDEYFLGATGRADASSAPYCPWNARPVAVTPE